MKYSSLCCLTGAFLATAAFAGVLAADVPPPEDYVETCTLDQQQKAGEQCVTCQASVFDKPNPCQEQYEPLGYSHRCNSYGNSHTEIWCNGSAQGAGGSAGAGNTEEAEAGQGGASNARPGPGSGGADSFAPTGGASADPKPSSGGTSAKPTPNTGGGTNTGPTSNTGGGTNTDPTSNTGASSTTQSTGTGAVPSTSDREEEGGCSLAAAGSIPNALLPGLGILLGLLGVRRRSRK